MSSDPITFDWPGRELALDLADTIVVVRPGHHADVLSTRAELATWLSYERERLGPVPRGALPRLTDFRELRDAIHALFTAVAEGQPLQSAPVRTLNRVAAAAPRLTQLDLSCERPRAVERSIVPDRTDEILATIARSAIEILGGTERVRVCPAPRCGMFYLETHPRQRWCSPMCGNRARVARHYSRTGARRG